MSNRPSYKETLNLPKTDFPMKANLVAREPELLLQHWEETDHLQTDSGRPRGRVPFSSCTTARPSPTATCTWAPHSTRSSRTSSSNPRPWPVSARPTCPVGIATACPSSSRSSNRTAASAPVEVRRRSEELARKFIDIQRRQFKRLAHLRRLGAPLPDARSRLRGGNPPRLRPIGRARVRLPEQEARLLEHRRAHGARRGGGRIPRGGRPGDLRQVRAHRAARSRARRASSSGRRPPGRSPPTRPSRSTPASATARRFTATRTRASRTKRSSRQRAGRDPSASATGYTREERPSTTDDDRCALPRRRTGGLALPAPVPAPRSEVILGEFVTMDAGTGCVHIAPGHGNEDLPHRPQVRHLPVFSPVDDDGRFTEECGVPELVGQYVFDANPDASSRCCGAHRRAGGRARSTTPTRIAGAPRCRSSSARWTSSSSAWTNCAPRLCAPSTR